MSESSSLSNNIHVFVRVRPDSPNSKDSCVIVDDKTHCIELLSKPTSQTYYFDAVASGSNNQAKVFESVGKPITLQCINGYNGTIFAYGQTGSGKTYTIQGLLDRTAPAASNSNPEPITSNLERGLMPRVFEYLFNEVRVISSNSPITYQISASFVEIYNDNIYDLLDNKQLPLSLREDTVRGVYVEGLNETTVNNSLECLKLMNAGLINRKVGETAMNRESSRSHCVFTLAIKSSKLEANGSKTEKYSRFNLIDLAGSERQKSTEAEGVRLKEASKINKSLSTLGNVIRTLVDISESGKDRHVPYRDSKLTYLLRDSLGGNSLCYIIACVSGSNDCYAETSSTLKFATRAKCIQNKAKINERKEQFQMELLQLQKENIKLKALLEQQKLEIIQSSNNKLDSKQQENGIVNSIPVDSAVDYSELHSLAINRESDWLNEIKSLEAKIKQYQNLQQSTENKLLTNKMIISLRNKTINLLQSLQNKNKNNSNTTSELNNNNIKQIINQLVQEQQEIEEKLVNTTEPLLIAKQLQITQLQQQIELLESSNTITITNNNINPNTNTSSNRTPPHHAAHRLHLQLLSAISARDLSIASLAEMKSQLSNPEALLQSLSTPQRRKFQIYEIEKYKAEQNYTNKISNFNEQIMELEAKLSIREEEFNSLMNIKLEVENKNQQLHNNVNQLENEMKKIIERNTNERKQLQTMFEQQIQLITTQQQNNNNTNTNINNKHNQKLLMEHAQLQLDHENLSENFKQTQLTNTEQSKVIDELKQQIELLNNDMKQKQIQHEQDFNSKLENKNKELIASDSKLMETQQLLTNLSLEFNKFKEFHNEESHLLNEYQSKYDEKCEETEQVQFKLDSLTEDHEELMQDYSFFTVKYNQLKEENNELKLTMEKFNINKENNNSTDNNNHNKENQQDYRLLEEKYIKLQNERNEFELTINQLSIAVKDYQSNYNKVSEEFTSIKSESNDIHTECIELRKKLTETQLNLECAESAAEELLTELKKKECELAAKSATAIYRHQELLQSQEKLKQANAQILAISSSGTKPQIPNQSFYTVNDAKGEYKPRRILGDLTNSNM